MKEYEEKAVSLALNRSKLQALTNKLKAARMTCPLFDTERWVCIIVFVFFLTCHHVHLKKDNFLKAVTTTSAGKEFGEVLFQNVESALLGSTSPAFQGH